MQARTGRALLRRAEAILKHDSVCWERVLSMHTILGMLHGRYGGCLQVHMLSMLSVCLCGRLLDFWSDFFNACASTLGGVRKCVVRCGKWAC